MRHLRFNTLSLALISIISVVAAPAWAQDLSQPASASARPKPPLVVKKHKAPDGVKLTLDLVGNIASNPVGGVRHGTEQSGWVMGEAKFDLGKLWGWTGTTLDTQAAWFGGGNLAREEIGNSISAQQTWRPVAGGRLTRFTLTHKFQNGLSIMAGRAPVNSYFNNSPLNCVFMSNASCLTPYGAITDIGISAYPNSSWAAMVRYDFNDRWYVQTGAFDYNPNLNKAHKNGLDFSLGQGTGTIAPAEVGYKTTFANDRLPRQFVLGMYHNSDGGSSPYYDINGNSAALTSKPKALQTGSRVGWYVSADQTVWRGEGQRNVALFGRVFVNTGNTAPVKWFASLGMVKTGTFPGRDHDTFSTFVSDTHFDDLEMAYLRDRRFAHGGSGTPHNDEIIGEINYGMAVVPGLRVLPNIQYVIHPDPIYAATRRTNIPDAVIVGVRLDVHLAQLMGW